MQPARPRPSIASSADIGTAKHTRTIPQNDPECVAAPRSSDHRDSRDIARFSSLDFPKGVKGANMQIDRWLDALESWIVVLVEKFGESLRQM